MYLRMYAPLLLLRTDDQWQSGAGGAMSVSYFVLSILPRDQPESTM